MGIGGSNLSSTLNLKGDTGLMIGTLFELNDTRTFVGNVTGVWFHNMLREHVLYFVNSI